MVNPILQAMQANTPAIPNSNPIQMLRQFAEFKKQLQGRDPQAIVQELLKSGKMSQAQFEQLKQQAQRACQVLYKSLQQAAT